MKTFLKPNLDKLGVCTSVICGVHCLFTPLLILLLPFAGLTFLESESFETAILCFSVFIAIASFGSSYLRQHKKIGPILIAGLGFIFFLLGKMFSMEVIEIGLSLVGGSLLVLAHLRNRILVKKTVTR